VWQERDPLGFQQASISATPNKVPLEDSQEVTLKPSLHGIKAGDYSVIITPILLHRSMYRCYSVPR